MRSLLAGLTLQPRADGGVVLQADRESAGVLADVLRGLAAAIDVPHLYSDDTPQIGNTFRVRVNQAAPSTIALLLLGFSATDWNGIPLPLPLGQFGAPGCSLLVENSIASVLLTNGAGATNLQYTLPYNIYALGGSFYNQAFVYDPTANAFGFVASNGGHGVFGNQ